MNMRGLTPKQIQMLRDFERDGVTEAGRAVLAQIQKVQQ